MTLTSNVFNAQKDTFCPEGNARSELLKKALSEIEANVRSFGKGIQPKCDAGVSKVLHQCTESILALRHYYSESNIIQQNEEAQALLHKFGIEPSKANDLCSRVTNTNVAENVFPEFDTKYLEYCFLEQSTSAVKILPYFLTVYYLHMQKSGSPVALRDNAFSRRIEVDNYHRDLKNFLTKFTYETYFQNLQKRSHEKYCKVISCIKDQNSFEAAINAKPWNQLHMAQIVRAFLYSLFTWQCILEPSISERIDYNGSRTLFDQQTAAFSSLNSSLSAVAWDKDDTDLPVKEDDKENDCSEIYTRLKKTLDMTVFSSSCLERCGVSLDALKMVETTRKDGFEKLQAIFCFVELLSTIDTMLFQKPLGYDYINTKKQREQEQSRRSWKKILPLY